MPLTLTEENYKAVMVKKGAFDAAGAVAHHGRMQTLKSKLSTGKKIFGCVDVGASSFWWDYGMLHLFIRNPKLLREENEEAHGLRRFLGIPDKKISDSDPGKAVVENTVLLASTLKTGTVQSS